MFDAPLMSCKPQTDAARLLLELCEEEDKIMRGVTALPLAAVLAIALAGLRSGSSYAQLNGHRYRFSARNVGSKLSGQLGIHGGYERAVVCRRRSCVDSRYQPGWPQAR